MFKVTQLAVLYTRKLIVDVIIHKKGQKKYIKHTLSAVSIYGNVILTSYLLLVSYSAFLLKSEACH